MSLALCKPLIRKHAKKEILLLEFTVKAINLEVLVIICFIGEVVTNITFTE